MTDPTHLDLANPGVLMPLLKRHQFHTSKGLGQHFLISRKVVDAIVAACEPRAERPVLEIGPGVGTVTRALAERGVELTAVELDARAIEVLRETVGEFPRVTVVQGDILALDLSALLGARRWTVVGNLPYYITTPVIAHVLGAAAQIDYAVFMVQREVAERMSAAPGGKVYGSLSVFVQVYAEVERILRVPKGAFLPPPTVDSTVLRLVMRREPLVPVTLQPIFFTVVRAAFGQRRKTLENALMGGGILGGDRQAVAGVLKSSQILAGRRGETLSVAEFLSIAEEVSRHQ